MDKREELPLKTPNDDLMESALKHYEEAASAIHHWNSDIPKAIKLYYTQQLSALPEEVKEEDIAKTETDTGKIVDMPELKEEGVRTARKLRDDILKRYKCKTDDGLHYLTIRDAEKAMEEYHAKSMRDEILKVKAIGEKQLKDWSHNDMCEHAIEARGIIMACDHLLNLRTKNE